MVIKLHRVVLHIHLSSIPNEIPKTQDSTSQHIFVQKCLLDNTQIRLKISNIKFNYMSNIEIIVFTLFAE